MLKRVVHNIRSFDRDVLPQELDINSAPLTSSPPGSFLVDFQEFSSNLYVLRAKDLDHALTLEMILERKESFVSSKGETEEEACLAPIISCTLPRLDVQKFNEKACWNEVLQEILMIQFQLKVLEQLFLFCEEKDAVNLILAMHDSNLDYLEMYRDFFISEEQVITARGEHTEVVIPIDVETYNKVIDFMDEVDKYFRQTLWREQKANPVFQEYLRMHFLSVF